MTWLDYIVTVAAPHSKYNAKQWFRYLRKDIDKDISKEQIDLLYNSTTLTPFQRVSLKAAFTADSPTRQYILDLNKRAVPDKILLLREKYENNQIQQ